MPGSSPRQHDHERRYTQFSHQFIPTRRIWKEHYNGQMIFGTVWTKNSLHLTCRWGKPPKSLTPETCPDRRSNTDPLRDRRASYRLLLSGGRWYVHKENIRLCSFMRKKPSMTGFTLISQSEKWLFVRHFICHIICITRQTLSFRMSLLINLRHLHC